MAVDTLGERQWEYLLYTFLVTPQDYPISHWVVGLLIDLDLETG